jgi:hypothetical protein
LSYFLFKLEQIDVLDSSSGEKFAGIINQANVNQTTTTNQPITTQTQENFQQVIRKVESLIESVNSSLNITDAAVAVISRTKTNPIYHLSQTISNSSQIYSSESNKNNNSIASITIDQISVDNLSENEIYSFFFLPSSMFYYAQEDHSINILSPIVGAHLPNEKPLNVTMSFEEAKIDHSLGTYSCVFWQVNRWNDTGCIHSQDSSTRRHYCVCDHLTSFALIFTPNGTLSQTSIPSAVAAILSIIGLVLSICLSVYQQTTSRATQTPRYLSLTNIFSLSSTLILFILLTVTMFRKHQSSTGTNQCQSSTLNLASATYFFVIVTFISKTLLGVYYFLTIFVRFALVQWTSMPVKWFVCTLGLIIILALIPTIVARQLPNVLVQYENICWFSSTYLIKFLTIPISIFIGINVIIIIIIAYRLIRFASYKTASTQSKNGRFTTGICIWISSCILLGVAWVIGPLLGVFIDENGRTSSTVGVAIQWIFAILIGLEGVWVLIVNIIFYLNQRPIRQYQASDPSPKKKDVYINDDFSPNQIATNAYKNIETDKTEGEF